MFVDESGASFRCSTQVGSEINLKILTKLDRLSGDKHSSLLRIFINYELKKFCNVGSRCLKVKVNFGDATKVNIFKTVFFLGFVSSFGCMVLHN